MLVIIFQLIFREVFYSISLSISVPVSLFLADRFRTQRARMGPRCGARPHLVALWTDGVVRHELNI